MFSKLDKKAISESNSQVEQELHSAKPTPQEKDNTKARDIAGNALSLIGQIAGIIAGVGACGLILNGAIGVIGISAVWGIAILAGFGVASLLIGNKLMINNWLQPVMGV